MRCHARNQGRPSKGMLRCLLCLVTLTASPGFAQPASSKAKQNSSWTDSSVAVQVEAPYISEKGLLVLQYTLANKSGKDLVIYREGHEESSDILKHDETKLFRRLKSGVYDEISPKDNSVAFFTTSLPADVPVRLMVAFQLPKQEESWWSKKSELRPRQAIKLALPDVDAIVLLIPSRRIRIILPVK